jgi:hypothetical protein
MDESSITLPPATTKPAFITQKGEQHDTNIRLRRDSPDLDVLLKGQTSQATLLLRKKNNLREVNDALVLKKEEFKKRMEETAYKQIEFESKLLKHRDEKIKFEQFIQENLAKKQRSELKAKNEHKLFEEKCKQLEQLQEKLIQMESQVKDLSQEILKKKMYKDFLDKCVGEGKMG